MRLQYCIENGIGSYNIVLRVLLGEDREWPSLMKTTKILLLPLALKKILVPVARAIFRALAFSPKARPGNWNTA